MEMSDSPILHVSIQSLNGYNKKTRLLKGVKQSRLNVEKRKVGLSSDPL